MAGAPFASWLYRISANAIADQARREALSDQELPELSHFNSSEIDLEGIERRAHLFRAVDRLPQDQRRVIFLRFAEEKSLREIAMELDRSEGAVKQLQLRALENLRARL